MLSAVCLLRKRAKKPMTNWEKVSGTCKTDTGLIARIYIYIYKSYKLLRKRQMIKRKIGKRLNK